MKYWFFVLLACLLFSFTFCAYGAESDELLLEVGFIKDILTLLCFWVCVLIGVIAGSLTWRRVKP